MNHTKQHGFTVIELIVVAIIISTLCAIAIPNYQSYIIRAKLVEVSEISTFIRKDIADYYAYHGVMPKDNQALFLPKPESFKGTQVSAMEVDNGAIHVTVNIKSQAPMMISIRPVMLKPALNNNVPLDYMTWLYGNCPLTNTETMQVLGTNKTTLTEAQKSWLHC